MQFHFGHKIIIVFIAFATLMGVLVYKSIHTQFYLVSKEYYKDELAYQQIINASKNAVAAKKNIRVSVAEQQLFISFICPDSTATAIQGTLIIYNPSGNEGDVQLPINVSTKNEQIINVASLKKGNYIIKAMYTINNISYYNTATITL